MYKRSHYLQGFIQPRWLFGISSINSSTITPQKKITLQGTITYPTKGGKEKVFKYTLGVDMLVPGRECGTKNSKALENDMLSQHVFSASMLYSLLSWSSLSPNLKCQSHGKIQPKSEKKSIVDTVPETSVFNENGWLVLTILYFLTPGPSRAKNLLVLGIW